MATNLNNSVSIVVWYTGGPLGVLVATYRYDCLVQLPLEVLHSDILVHLQARYLLLLSGELQFGFGLAFG